LYILSGDDPDQVIFVISVRGQIGAIAVYAKWVSPALDAAVASSDASLV
jgi:hypothetical protein